MQITKSKWFLPLFSVALGLVIFGAQATAARHTRGSAPLAGLSYLAAVVLLRVRG
jgi:hypothetical protein